MAEPTSTAVAAATFAMAGVAVPTLAVFGMQLGLRADVLLAGFLGALAGFSFLNTVPSTGDTLKELVRTTVRRGFVALASSTTAGYLVPAMMDHAAAATVLACSFVVGAGAQKILIIAIDKFGTKGSLAP